MEYTYPPKILDTLVSKSSMRNTPLTEGGVHHLPYITLSLIDRGLADTRAIAIGNALEKGDMSGLSWAILECDSYNFPLLVKLEPRLFEMLLSWNQTHDPIRVVSKFGKGLLLMI